MVVSGVMKNLNPPSGSVGEGGVQPPPPPPLDGVGVGVVVVLALYGRQSVLTL